MSEDAGKGSPLFRKKALDRLFSPDQLNQLIIITTPLGWFSLATVGGVLLFAIVWGFLGSIPTTVSGGGILLRGGRMANVVALGAGQIEMLEVRVGDSVTNGQVIGKVTQPILEAEIQGQQSLVAEFQKNLDQVTKDQNAALEKQLTFYEKQRTSLKESVKDYTEQVESLDKIVKSQEELKDRGLITEVTLLQTRSQYNQAQLDLLDAENKLVQVDTNEIEARNTAKQAIFSAQNSLMQASESLSKSVAQLKQTSMLVSRHNGHVVDLSAFMGQAVTEGSSVATIESLDEPMQALIYFSASDGKKVHEGMVAQISPSTAEEDEFGYIVGTIIEVADVPSSQESVSAVLQNDNLVKQYCSDGAPIRVISSLELDPDNFSGFVWSSSHGPQTEITSGTVCSAQIIVKEQPPITLVIPLLKRFFGIKDY